MIWRLPIPTIPPGPTHQKRKTNVTRPHISAPLVESFVVTESGALYTSLETSPRRPAPSRGSIESVPLKTQSSLFHDRLADGLAIRPSLPSSIGQKPSPPEAGKKSTRGRPRSRSFSGFLKGPDVAQTFLRPQDQFTMNFSTNLVISQSSTSLPNSPVALNAIPLPFTGSGPRKFLSLCQSRLFYQSADPQIFQVILMNYLNTTDRLLPHVSNQFRLNPQRHLSS